jgi:hypothetical protein
MNTSLIRSVWNELIGRLSAEFSYNLQVIEKENRLARVTCRSSATAAAAAAAGRVKRTDLRRRAVGDRRVQCNMS